MLLKSFQMYHKDIFSNMEYWIWYICFSNMGWIFWMACLEFDLANDTY